MTFRSRTHIASLALPHRIYASLVGLCFLPDYNPAERGKANRITGNKGALKKREKKKRKDKIKVRETQLPHCHCCVHLPGPGFGGDGLGGVAGGGGVAGSGGLPPARIVKEKNRV